MSSVSVIGLRLGCAWMRRNSTGISLPRYLYSFPSGFERLQKLLKIRLAAQAVPAGINGKPGIVFIPHGNGALQPLKRLLGVFVERIERSEAIGDILIGKRRFDDLIINQVEGAVSLAASKIVESQID